MKNMIPIPHSTLTGLSFTTSISHNSSLFFEVHSTVMMFIVMFIVLMHHTDIAECVH